MYHFYRDLAIFKAWQPVTPKDLFFEEIHLDPLKRTKKIWWKKFMKIFCKGTCSLE
jgi:hypothetical protein